MEGISVNQLISKVDEYNINYDFNNNNDDLYYNDFICNYDEVQKKIVKYCQFWRCERGYFICRCDFINTCMYVFWNVKKCKEM